MAWTKKMFARCVLAAGAVASVATSRVTEDWQRSNLAGIDSTTIGDDNPLRLYTIETSLRATENFGFVGGLVSATVRLHGRDVTGIRDAQVAVTLRSVGGTQVFERRVVPVGPGETVTAVLSAPAWNACSGRLCEERYELTIERTELADDPLVDIAGEVEVEATGDDPDGEGLPPAGTLLDLDVIDMGPVS